MSSLQQVLTEIVEKITIYSPQETLCEQDFTISHPDYPALGTDLDTIDKLTQISVELQTRYLVTQLQTYLHDLYFSHRSISHQEVADRQPQTVKNNMIDGIDINFYPQLQQSNTSSGYFDPGWQILATAGEELIVTKDGLQLHINPHQHLALESHQATPGTIVPIYLPHNSIGQDTYIAIGNAGNPSSLQSIQIYFNFTPDAAIAITRQLTTELNRMGMPFQFAILHDPAAFHRWDAGTLWLDRSDYHLLQPVLADIYHSNQAAFSPNIPLFTKQLAPGLGLAEVPLDSNCFGLHRCQLLATGLVIAIERGQISVAEKLNCIQQEFITAGIDLSQPYLNPAEIDAYPDLFG
jgi:HopA1 effector protein family